MKPVGCQALMIIQTLPELLKSKQAAHQKNIKNSPFDKQMIIVYSSMNRHLDLFLYVVMCLCHIKFIILSVRMNYQLLMRAFLNNASIFKHCHCYHRCNLQYLRYLYSLLFFLPCHIHRRSSALLHLSAPSEDPSHQLSRLPMDLFLLLVWIAYRTHILLHFHRDLFL